MVSLPILIVLFAIVSVARAQTTCVGAATALRADFRADSPALTVRASPHFSWVVPASASGADAAQAAYRIVVAPLAGGAPPVWDSGRVASNLSVAVPFGGAAGLAPGAAFSWSVSVWLGDGSVCPQSQSASFVVALGAAGWAPGAAWIVASTPAAANQFSFLRREVPAPASPDDVVLAVLHATALTDPFLLGFRAYVGGVLVGVGPGRGEAPVWGGDGAFRDLPYVSYDVTAAVRASSGPASNLSLAAVAIGSLRSNASRGVLLQLDTHFADGSVTMVATDTSWDAFDADVYLRPTPDSSGQTAYQHSLENTDARLEPVDWRAAGFAGGGPSWAPAIAVQRAADAGPAAGLTPTMAAPLELTPLRAPTRVEALSPTLGFFDFGREFQGGLVLSVAGGGADLAGARITLVAGEHVRTNLTVDVSWGENDPPPPPPPNPQRQSSN